MKATYRSQSQSGNVFQHNLASGQSQISSAPQGHIQTNLYATNGSLIKDFITRKEYYLDDSTERRPALINRYGFIAALIDGFTSDGNKRLEIGLPESADLSITQNGGFSLFFWFLLKKSSQGVHRFIVKRGNTIDEMTPSVGILPNGTNLFIKMNSSKHRVETLFSNKKIEFNRMYSVSVTFSIDYMNDLTDISLYLDGLLDSQITVPGEPLHNQGNLYIGKSDALNYGFVGCVADVLLIPRVLLDNEISNIHKECVMNLNHTKTFGSYEIFSKKLERDILIQKYAQYTGNHEFIIENLELTNDELREIVKKFDQEMRDNENNDNITNNNFKQTDAGSNILNSDEKIISQLAQFLGPEDSDNSITARKIAMNARFIYTVLFLVNSNEDELDVKRIPGVFEILKETLHIEIEEKFVRKIAEILTAFNNENKCVKLQTFFKNLKFYVGSMYPDMLLFNNSQINHNSNTAPATNGFNFYQSANNTGNNFPQGAGMSEFNSVELHENLLLNSQNFKNYIDDDLERSLAKSTFTIRSLYSRIKSGTRPLTSKGYGSSRGEDADYVNQQFNSNNQFDHIPEKHEGHDEEAEDALYSNNNNVNNEIEKNNNYGSGSNEHNPEKVKIVDHINSNNDEYNIHNEEKEIGENLNVNVNNNVDPSQINEVTEKKETSSMANQAMNQDEGDNTNTGNPETGVKKEESNNQNQNLDAPIINPTPNPVSDIKSSSRGSKVTSSKILQSPDKPTINLDSPGQGSMIQTNFDDIISNFENKVIIKSSDRDTAKAFLDPDNMIPVNNLGSSQDLGNQTRQGEEILPTKNDVEPKFPNDWNEGAFEIVISHCFDCHKHKTTTRHLEYTFVDKFNEIGDSIKSLFPNAHIVGNAEKPEYFGIFDIYLRGVGPRLDEKNRFYLFKKINTKKFPTPREIGDKLIALAMLYGSSSNLEAAQKQYHKAYSEIFEARRFKGEHEHPLALSEDAEKMKEENEGDNKKVPHLDPERTKLFCTNYGCGITLVQVENGPNKCTYHPGVWQFGSHHGYWPEAWSCCERGWDSVGCTTGSHKPVRLDSRVMLCLNHGEVNPNSNHPDSACGVYYTPKDKDPCKHHPGIVNKSGIWTCCGVEKKNLEGCTETEHATADWPDEKAKLFFYPKPVINPGIRNDTENKRLIIAGQMIQCAFFKQIKPYDNPMTKMELLRMKRDKEKDEARYCTRYACDKIYKEADNGEKSCKCHPGKWDHGSTGSKMVDFIREMNTDPKSLEKTTILWKPHWTCCRGEWNAPGCRRMKHRGPVAEEFLKSGRNYKWPDQRLKLHFPKIVSDKWKMFLQKYMYPEPVVKAICKKFFSEGRVRYLEKFAKIFFKIIFIFRKLCQIFLISAMLLDSTSLLSVIM